MSEGCPVCGLKEPDARSDVRLRPQHHYWVECKRCGRFSISYQAFEECQHLDSDKVGLLSGWLRERLINDREQPELFSSGTRANPLQEFQFSISEILAGHVPQSINEVLERALRNLAKLSKPGSPVRLEQNHEEAVFFADSREQQSYYIKAMKEYDWLEHIPGPDGVHRLYLRPKAWQRIADLELNRLASSQGFVAMSFKNELESAWRDGLFEGIKRSGYDPNRIDKTHHNEKICDLILAEIRKSRFVVADFTEQRAGVYFEAGFARGLGIEVFWTCREDQKDDCHFDTRQYNHIFWKTPEQLASQLQEKIEAVMGRGPKA